MRYDPFAESTQLWQQPPRRDAELPLPSGSNRIFLLTSIVILQCKAEAVVIDTVIRHTPVAASGAAISGVDIVGAATHNPAHILHDPAWIQPYLPHHVLAHFFRPPFTLLNHSS